MTRKAKRRLQLIVGWGFLVLGVLGLFLPILQGVLFLLVGVIILAKAQPRFRLLKRKLKKRYPKYAGTFEAAERRAAEIFRGRFFKGKRRR